MSNSIVIVGQFSIAYTSAHTLIDSRASHSFVSASFIKKLDMVPELLDDVCNISLSLGKKLPSRFSFKVEPVKITRRELPVVLRVLELVDYDVILCWE